MKQHEREYLVSKIRSGVYFINDNNITLKIVTPNICQEFEINQAYMDAYKKALNDNFMTFDDMLAWMDKKGLWTAEDEYDLDVVKKDIERLKIEIFNSKNDKRKRETIRAYIRAAEKHQQKLNQKKFSLYENSCESIASVEKTLTFLKLCTYVGGQIFPLLDSQINDIMHLYYSEILEENQVREISRSEPWRSLWILNESRSFELFDNKLQNRELSIDQKNLLVWSKMYDNIQESPDCPSNEVIEDDDMLDGWFIIQKNKREKDKIDAEVEEFVKNEKIKNSNEVLIMAKDKESVQNIEKMNNMNAKVIKKQRSELLKKNNVINQADFQDEKLKISNQSAQMFKNNFRR